MRTIKAGLDYGTSASKAVFWDELSPGKPKAFIVQQNSDLRISSSVALIGDVLQFGSLPQTWPGEAAVWFESVKMRVAGEALPKYREFCYGGRPSPPLPLGFKDLATLTVWYLRSVVETVVQSKLGISKSEFALSLTLGVPRCFYEDATLRATFLDIAVCAQELQKRYPFPGSAIRMADAQEALHSVRVVGNQPHQYQDWLRSEAEAAMFWPVKSAEIPSGGYAEIDIGAGTTNASIVGIWATHQNGRWIKQNLGFHGAFANPVGMDAIDKVIGTALGVSAEECLKVRGQERELMPKVQVGKLAPVYNMIAEAYQFAWRRAQTRLTAAERQTFPDHDIFVSGGGSFIPLLVDFLAVDRGRRSSKRKVRGLEPPSDLYYLDSRPVDKADLAFAAPAYGLSFSRDEIPAEYICGEEPVKMPKTKGLSVIYEK